MLGIRSIALLGVIAWASLPTAASAVPIQFNVVGVGDARLQASVTFAYDKSKNDIKVTVKNTSTASDDWRITGIAFNVPGTYPLKAFKGAAGWSAQQVPDGIDTPGNYGLFDMAALTGSSFASGNVSKGIQKDKSSSFTFTIQGQDAGLLSQSSFLSALSTGESASENSYFAVRFERTGALGDIGVPQQPQLQQSSIPEPGLALLLLAGAALTLSRHRRRAGG